MTQPYPDPADAPWALLARHLAAEATATEQAALRAWVRADPAHLQILTTVTRAWERAGTEAPAPVVVTAADVEAAWQRLRPRLAPRPAPGAGAATGSAPGAAAASTPPPQRPAPRLAVGRRVARRWRLVAGLALLLGTGLVLARTWLSRPAQLVQAYASAAGRQRLALPDGSRVWLNARSRLRYAGRAAAGPRAVQLTGEAYFEVAPDPARPFVVSTTTARVRVVGTAFNLRAYAAEDSVEVSVTQGRVWLAHLGQPDSVLLAAGTRAALRASDAPGRVAATLRSRPAADPNFRAWQTDTLRFADAPVARVARALQVTFGTQVALAPALARCRFTGTFVRPTPEQVLRVVAAATVSQLSPDGTGGYELHGPGCAAPPLPPVATPAPPRRPQP